MTTRALLGGLVSGLVLGQAPMVGQSGGDAAIEAETLQHYQAHRFVRFQYDVVMDLARSR